MENLNPVQIKILSRLLFRPGARFRELNADRLETNDFSYHIRTLLKAELIRKDINKCTLTAKGKMVASKIDTTNHTVEKQAKISVIVILHRQISGKEYFLIQQRTKEPYFGYWGFISGKIKFGETLEEAARRELREETGLKGNFRFCFELHEMVYEKQTGNQLEDKFFHIMEAYDLTGRLKLKTIEGRCKLVGVEEFWKIKPKYHNEDDLLRWFSDRDFKLKEEKYYIEKF